jgi:hypothetical protein
MPYELFIILLSPVYDCFFKRAVLIQFPLIICNSTAHHKILYPWAAVNCQHEIDIVHARINIISLFN